jgi:broad specificity phosphatase PhoE
MKEIYVLRHANWDGNQDKLIEEGQKKCLSLKQKLCNFDIVVASNRQRSEDTAKLLTGSDPEIDRRAGVLKTSPEQHEKIKQLRTNNPYGAAGAIFSIPELIKPVKIAGRNLIELVKEILSKLPKNGKALIISHDGTMVSAEKILKKGTFDKIDKTYHELEGYIINENLELKEYR